MTPEQLNAWRIIPRILMFAMIGMTYRTVEWFMSLPPSDQTTQAASFVSVVMGVMTGVFGIWMGHEHKGE